MRKLTLLITIAVVFVAGAEMASALNKGGFEDADLNPAVTLVVNPTNALQWWYGEDPQGWIRQGDPNYAPEGQDCAGVIIEFGNSGGLLQFVPIADDDSTVTLSFQYLLWRGFASTTAKYAVFGWNEGDVIDLSNFSTGGPGSDATEILSGDLTAPQYSGDENPSAAFSLYGDSAVITPGDYDYIGVWFQYNIRGGSFYVDDVQLNIQPTPEPGSLCLIGLGSVVLFLQRRRKS